MLHSFIKVEAHSHFPIQNLPYGVFRPRTGGAPRIGVAIGEYILDLAVLDEEGHFDSIQLSGNRIFHQSSLNAFMALGRLIWKEVRKKIQQLLSRDEPTLRDDWQIRKRALLPQRDVVMLLPAQIGDYTDFYASKQHATNVGIMFRGKDNALMPNWVHLPVGYHGRSSSIVVSGTDIHRPRGQKKPIDSREPIFGTSDQLDYELEMGWLIGPGNKQGEPISVETAEEHIFGLVLVNDWSARDIQAWEYQPLGPFLAKSFATSISPWVVPIDALEPFRVHGPEQKNPKPFPYLEQSKMGSFNINLEAFLQSQRMQEPQLICKTNFRNLYWSMAQKIAHHTVGGCNLRPGDLLATGTISGDEKGSRGCLLESTWRGLEPILMNNGEERIWIEDGDRITITGWCQGKGYRVGFGNVTGRVLPATIN